MAATCSICGRSSRKLDAASMCAACRKSYDRDSESDGGTVMDAMEWAARRAREATAEDIADWIAQDAENWPQVSRLAQINAAAHVRAGHWKKP